MSSSTLGDSRSDRFRAPFFEPAGELRSDLQRDLAGNSKGGLSPAQVTGLSSERVL